MALIVIELLQSCVCSLPIHSLIRVFFGAHMLNVCVNKCYKTDAARDGNLEILKFLVCVSFTNPN